MPRSFPSYVLHFSSRFLTTLGFSLGMFLVSKIIPYCLPPPSTPSSFGSVKIVAVVAVGADDAGAVDDLGHFEVETKVLAENFETVPQLLLLLLKPCGEIMV